MNELISLTPEDHKSPRGYSDRISDVEIAHGAALASNEARQSASWGRLAAVEYEAEIPNAQRIEDHVYKGRFKNILEKLSKGEIDEDEAFLMMNDLYAKRADEFYFHARTIELPDDYYSKANMLRVGATALTTASVKSIMRSIAGMKDYAERQDEIGERIENDIIRSSN